MALPKTDSTTSSAERSPVYATSPTGERITVYCEQVNDSHIWHVYVPSARHPGIVYRATIHRLFPAFSDCQCPAHNNATCWHRRVARKAVENEASYRYAQAKRKQHANDIWEVYA